MPLAPNAIGTRILLPTPVCFTSSGGNKDGRGLSDYRLRWVPVWWLGAACDYT